MEHEGSPAALSCRAFSLSQHASQISSRAAASTIPVTSAAVQANSRMSSHESIANLTPADVYFGRGQTILLQSERIKRQTIALRRLQHQLRAA